MRKMVRSIMLVVAIGAMGASRLAYGEATNMLNYMQSIGVPNPSTNNVLFFGWSPIVAPTDPSQVAELSALNLGLAMYDVGGQLRFTIVNGLADPLTASVIEAIYFDDGSTTENGLYFNTGTVVADSGAGVDFALGNSGMPDWTLPEGNVAIPVFDTTDTISWQRTGSVNNGVNSLPEYLTVGYNYVTPGASAFDNIVSTFLNGTTRIGMHVNGIGVGSFSESILWTPVVGGPPGPGPLDPDPPVVPVPAAAGLGFLGMALVGVMRCKKK